MKTLRVSLADIEGEPHGSHHANTNVTVTARYTGPVTLADGQIVPAAIKAKQLSTGATGYVDFEVYASDDPLVHADWRGFAIIVTATITHARSGKQLGQVARTVKVLTSHTSPVALGSLEPAEGLPAGFMTVSELNADIDARLDALESAPPPESGGVDLSPHPSWPWALIANADTPPDPDNRVPTVTINAATTVITNMDATLAWSGSDADGDPLTFVVDWGDGQTTSPAVSPATHSYASGGAFTATVTASDGQASGSATHTFESVDPNGPSEYHQAVIAAAPLMYFPLDEPAPPAVDLIAGTPTTSTSWPNFGAVGIGDGDTSVDLYAVGAVPSSAHINAGASSATNGLATYTFECIVEPADNSSSGYILNRDDASSNRVFRFSRNSRKFTFVNRGGGSVTTGDLNAGFVYHLVAVGDGTNLTLWVNGTIAAQVASTAPLPTKTIDLIIGGYDGNAFRFLGKIAGVAIYSRALTPTEIQAHTAAAGINA